MTCRPCGRAAPLGVAVVAHDDLWPSCGATHPTDGDRCTKLAMFIHWEHHNATTGRTWAKCAWCGEWFDAWGRPPGTGECVCKGCHDTMAAGQPAPKEGP